MLRYGKTRGLTWCDGGAGDHGVYAMAGDASDLWAVKKAMERCADGHKNQCGILFSGTAFARIVAFGSGGTQEEANLVRSGCGGLSPTAADQTAWGIGTHARGSKSYKSRCCFAEENMEVQSMWITWEHPSDPAFREPYWIYPPEQNLETIRGPRLEQTRQQLLLEPWDPSAPRPSFERAAAQQATAAGPPPAAAKPTVPAS